MNIDKWTYKIETTAIQYCHQYCPHKTLNNCQDCFDRYLTTRNYQYAFASNIHFTIKQRDEQP